MICRDFSAIPRLGGKWGSSELEMQGGGHPHCHSAMGKTTYLAASFYLLQIPALVGEEHLLLWHDSHPQSLG